MSGIATTLGNLEERIDALGLRERAVLFGATVLVICLVVLQVVLAPVAERQQRLKSQTQQRLNETAALQARFELLGRQYRDDPDAENRNRLAQLRGELEQLRASVGEVTRDLVSPAAMARLVEQALARNHSLEVLEVTSLPDLPLLEADHTGSDSAAAVLHRHGLRLKLRGTYREIVAYLVQLEGMQWRVFWGHADLVTTAWPRSEIEIVIYTLSRDAAWIGTG